MMRSHSRSGYWASSLVGKARRFLPLEDLTNGFHDLWTCLLSQRMAKLLRKECVHQSVVSFGLSPVAERHDVMGDCEERRSKACLPETARFRVL